MVKGRECRWGGALKVGLLLFKKGIYGVCYADDRYQDYMMDTVSCIQ